MQKRAPIVAAIGALIALCSGAVVARSTSTNDRMNVVFFLVDDLGWTDIGAFGSTFYDTPNVDALAARGMVFTNAYASCPVCSPTRASIMAGKYPARLDTTDYFGAAQPDTKAKRWLSKPLLPARYVDRLPHEETTIAEAFKEEGYATFFAGKWHLGPEGWWAEDHGFDINIGGHTRGGPYGPGKYFTPYGNPRIEDGPEGEHLPDRLASETASFIEDNRDESFFAYLSFYSVHTPLVAREDLTEKYREKKKDLPPGLVIWGQERERKVRLVQEHAVYGAMVEAMDLAVGKVVDKVDELGLADRTVFVFMSDNGGLSTSEGHPTSNLPLRAGKGWMYEGGIREPMFIVWPGATEPGSSTDTPVTSTDFYPTLLEICGLPARPEQHLDGVSLVPLLTQSGETPDRDLFWHYPHYGNQGGAPSGAVRNGDWKLIEWYEDGEVELFNLRDDIGELENRAGDEHERAGAMLERLRAWRASVDAKMPGRNPRFSESED